MKFLLCIHIPIVIGGLPTLAREIIILPNPTYVYAHYSSNATRTLLPHIITHQQQAPVPILKGKCKYLFTCVSIAVRCLLILYFLDAI